MKVLVTGANGLLGSYIVRELQKRGYKVRVIVRKESNLSNLEGTGVEMLPGRITMKEDVDRAVEGCGAVIHVAAMTGPKPSRIEPYILPNITSTRYLLDAGEKYKINRFVFVSTANCFGNGSEAEPGDENRPFMPWLKKSGYAYSKYKAQQMVLHETKTGKIDAVVVNPTFIIGLDENMRSSSRIFSYILYKRIAFYPPGGKNFVDAEAAASGTVNAMEKGKRGECYLLAGENLSYSEFYRLASGIAGQKPLLIPIPSFLIKLSGYIGDFSERIFNSPVQLTSVNARMLCMDNYYTPAKAMKELDFTFVPAEIAIKNAFKKN